VLQAGYSERGCAASECAVKLQSKQQNLAPTKRATEKQAMKKGATARISLEMTARASLEADAA
jgi:hypothetical protein